MLRQVERGWTGLPALVVPQEPALGWVSQPEAQVIAWQEQELVEQLSVRHFLRAVAETGRFFRTHQ